MKNFTKPVIWVACFLVFILCFLVSLHLSQSTAKVIQFITGINKWEYTVKEQTTVYFSDETEMGKIGYKKEYTTEFPELMKTAVVAVEDKRFYEHSGFDARGIGRAIWNNLRSGSKSEGGSTITQQLARTLFLNQEKTYTRKIKEVFIASAIEDKYTKEGILNLYLNEIYIGRGCSGMQCAAQSYFGKDVMELNSAEITALVGMIQAPEYYTPENFEALKKRQATVIEILVQQGIITEADGNEILSQPLYFKKYVPYPNEHPYLMAYINSQLKDKIGAQKLYQGGLKIYTTIDRNMQNAAEMAIANNVRAFGSKGINARDAALVSIDPDNGDIKAMVGGTDYNRNQINMAIAARQPGSAIKPLYYAAAINEGLISADTVLNNKTRDFGGGYMPTNMGKNSPSRVTATQALVNSYNVASVEVLNMMDINRACQYLQDFGITSIKEGDKTLALALGGMERGISPLQMAAAYAVFPAGGLYHSPHLIDSVVDENGDILYTPESYNQWTIKAETAQTITDILQQAVRYGTGTSARIGIASAGKTGTTTDSRDLWFVGYTSDLVTAVWVGNSDGQPVSGYSSYGGSVSGPIWRDYMNRVIYNGKAPAIEEEKTESEEEPEQEVPLGEEESPDNEEPKEGNIDEENPVDDEQEPIDEENPDQRQPDPGEAQTGPTLFRDNNNYQP